MTDEEKDIKRQFRENMSLSTEQIAAMEREDDLMSRPDDDPEKIAYIFEKAREN